MHEMERELELSLSSDKRLFLRMLLDDNRTRSLEQAKAALEEILSLPFNREMAKNMMESAVARAY
jgi:alpha-galactosidase/6-phospho-beta-glucosidase family protein